MQPGVEAAACHSVPHKLKFGLDWLTVEVAKVLLVNWNKDTRLEVHTLPEEVRDKAVLPVSINQAP